MPDAAPHTRGGHAVDDQIEGVRTEDAQSDGPAGGVGRVGSDNQRIGVGSGDENVAKIQLAARWAEQYAPDRDSLEAALQRFYRAYSYIDSVTHNVTPDEP